MIRSLLALVVLGAVTVGCGDSIPEAYRGDFVDRNSGAILRLSSDSGDYKEMSGRALEGRSYKMTFDDLRSGKPGVYFKDNPENKDILELFWLAPDLSSKQEAGGIEYYQTEIFYFRMNRKAEGKVDILQTVHSTEGIVSLDIPTSQWQVGWPAQSDLLEFKRTSK